MKFEAVPLSEAKGKIVGHNIAGLDGKRLLRKGKPLTDEDIESLSALAQQRDFACGGSDMVEMERKTLELRFH